MNDEQYSKPEFTSSTFVQSAPTNDQDVYITIVQEVMSHREGVVDAMLFSDIEDLWNQYVNRKRRKT
jgi:hypothetical protein